jgi:ribonuclease D
VSWIDTPTALAEALPSLRQAREIAIDTEADSYYVYKVKVCLLQVSTRERDFLIDPLVGLDLSPLAAICGDREVLKVFHAGANDVALLRARHSFAFVNLFDTMLASQVLGLKRPGLAALLQERFNVEQKKTYQTSDWRKRPLSEGQLAYAAADTRHLLELKDQLERELVARGRREEAEEEFERLRELDHTERVLDPDSFRRAAGAVALDPIGQRVLQELFLLRDRIAAKRDRSPHRVFSDQGLVGLALAQPTRHEELHRIDGLPRWQIEREEAALLETIASARAKGPLPRSPRRPRTQNGDLPLTESERVVFEALRSWRRERAAAREVEESRVATTDTLRQLARERGLTRERLIAVPGMTPFRVREYGDEIVSVVAGARGAAG